MLLVLRQQQPGWVMSRSSLWRILEAADLKPHRSVYWLNRHDPAFDAKAQDICQLYVNALRDYQHGRLVICTDEKTGMQILQRKYPTQPAQPGKPEKREHEYIRHGARVLLASFVVPTGPVLWNLGSTRTSEDFAAHLANVKQQLPAMARYDWVVDNLNTHWSLDVCELVATWCALPFVPKALQHRMWVDRDGARLSLMSQRVWGLRQHSEAGLQVGLRADDGAGPPSSRAAVRPRACVIDQGSRPQCCSNVTSARASAHVQGCCFHVVRIG